MSRVCSACRCSEFKVEPYPASLGVPSIHRTIADATKYLGWKALPAWFLRRNPNLARRFSEGLFKYCHVMICKECGLGIIDKMPSARQLDKYYRFAYAQIVNRDLNDASPKDLSQYEYLKTYLDLNSIKKFIEFGSGQAGFSRNLVEKHQHIEAFTVELSDTLHSQLKANKYIKDSFFHLRDAPADADLFLVSHVLEHMPDFRDALIEWKAHVRSGGYLFVEVPNCSPGHYIHLNIYHPHVFFFTQAAIRNIAVELKLEIFRLDIGGRAWDSVGSREPEPSPEKWYESKEDGRQLRVIFKV